MKVINSFTMSNVVSLATNFGSIKISIQHYRWVTFWINPRCLPERATISITVILAQVVLIFGIAAQYPSVSDLKMADIYVIMNFIFNFAGLIENILAAHFWVKTDKVFSLRLRSWKNGHYVLKIRFAESSDKAHLAVKV